MKGMRNIRKINDYRFFYLEDYINLLANAFDYALVDLNMEVNDFEKLFIHSRYAKLIEMLDPNVISGESGVELVIKMLEERNYNIKIVEKEFREYRTDAFWLGYALANYQFYKRKRFYDIFRKIHLEDILKMYKVYHEMDITNFIDDLDRMINNIELESKLKTIREYRGLSQSELAYLSNVSLRSIQLYEQKANDIDKAQAHTLYKLSNVLGCSIEDLLENPER